MEIIPLYKGKQKNILIISGGGLKGFSALGAIKNLIENEIITFPDIFAGTSVGGIICFLINIGYGPQDIYEMLKGIDFTNLIKYFETFDIITEACFGLMSPKPIIQIIYDCMKKKNISKNITFKELFDKTKSKLIITGTCINDVSLKYFSVDTYPDMPILKALRITISIPFIFKPYLFDNKLWVDGGLINNFPINLFIDKLDDVIGIYLDNHYENIDEITEVHHYIFRILKCINRGLNNDKLEIFKKYIINIITEENQSIDWDISLEEKERMFNIGYDKAQIYSNSILENFIF